MIRPLRAVTIAVLTALGAGSATTVVEDTDATTGEPVTIVTVDLGGSRDELLTQLDAELQVLSERIIENDGDEDARARIDALWGTLQTDLAADHPELLPGFQAVIDLAGSAVDPAPPRRRRQGPAQRRGADRRRRRHNAPAAFFVRLMVGRPTRSRTKKGC